MLIEVNETKENSVNNEKQTIFNILIEKIAQGDSLTIKTKCHITSFQHKVKKLNICGTVTPLKILWHGVSDNLYPP